MDHPTTIPLMLALIAFVGTHFLLSHPLRAPLVRAIGTGGFLGLYSLVALASLGWAVMAFRASPYGVPLWQAGDGLWALATAMMLVASILLVGSLHGNPALPGAAGRAFAPPVPRGVFAITRHPMMWSFAIWSVAHFIVSPRPAVLLVSLAILILALVGAAAQDAKKRRLIGDGWRDWIRRTAFVPFARGAAWPGVPALLGGTLLWLAATWAHPLLGAPLAGVWRWIG